MSTPVRIAALVFALSTALAGTAVTAQSRHNSDAPIDFGANNIELQDKANRAILSGSVSVKQADMTLNAARVTVAYTGQVIDGNPQVSRLDASGGVVVTRPSQSARGQFAVYDLKRRVVTMLGGVSLNQGGNVVNGARLTINLDSGRAVIDGSSTGTARPNPDGSAPTTTTQGGRVTGRFSVPKRN